VARHWSEGSEDYVKQRRGDAETQFGSLVVVQQVIFFEVPEEPESCSRMMRPEVEPFVIEVTCYQSGKEK